MSRPGMSRVADYQQKVGAMCACPALTGRQDKIDFLRRLVAYWTRQLNLHTRGHAISFTPLEVDEIIDFLEHEIRTLQNAQD